MGSCVSICSAPATMLHLGSIFANKQELTSLLSNDAEAATDGLNIQVGRSIDAQTTKVPQSVLDSNPSLNSLLVPGCRIVNADPAVFAIVIGHLQSASTFGLMSLSAPGHLQELALGDEPLLNFAKAWHIGDMLRMPDLQNRILKVYSTYYMCCLDNGICRSADRKPVDPRPFKYLSDSMGNHTKAERFLIDFHAGSMKNQTELRRDDFKMLPKDIAVKIRYRWQQLTVIDSDRFELSNDRITARDRTFNVVKNEAIVHSDLQVQYLCATGETRFGLNPPMTRSYRSIPMPPNSTASHHGSELEDLIVQRARHQVMRSGNASSASDLVNPRLTNPFVGGPSRRRDAADSPMVSPTSKP
ncbi:hypothetical protein C7974DRAFT_368373 [Boeremia exigua]|uniref:uncharacterized protein n=1 Tax=Boeremia exigua TaxID=749465 RepID=UPI001E8E9072|nr:uncharacterized protein C7974DRAFT_368373 [Boeremia exigua]KAH6614181.1 hypothetical protein C7974DRAFT_368373 [Boeremia exigua]